MAENFRYPLSDLNKDDDFIKFSIYNYSRGKRDITVEGNFGLGYKRKEKDESGKEFSRELSVSEDVPIANSKLVGGAAKGDFQGSITLPIPSQISDTNSTKFGESSLNSFYAAGLTKVLNITGSESVEDLASQLGKSGTDLRRLVQDRRVQGLVKLFAAQQAISSLGANLSLDQLLTRATGSIINPNMELLFSGPSLRNFKFQFKMTPREQPEAELCKKIIRKFKKSMSPIG